MMFQIECETCHATAWAWGKRECGTDEVALGDPDDACEHVAEGGEFAIIDEEEEFDEE